MVLAAVCMLLLALPATDVAGDQSGGDRPVAAVRIFPATVAPGDSGSIEVSFSLPPDLHVIADPAVEIRVPAQTLVTLLGAPERSVNGGTSSLEMEIAVRQRFVVSFGLRPRPEPLDVIVTYFYCSDTAGWCRIRSDTCRTTLVLSHP